MVDDCSQDNSAQIARKFSKRHPNVRFLRLNKNSGACVARNIGIEGAHGRYIAFLDSDDLWLPNKLEHQIRYMETTGAAFTCSAYERIDEQGKFLGQVCPPARMTYDQLLKANRIGCLTAVYDTQALGKVYMPELRKRQDFGLWLKLLKRVDAVHCLPEVLAQYRVRLSSMSSSRLDRVYWNWRLFREVERRPIHQSLYYLAHNIYHKVFE